MERLKENTIPKLLKTVVKCDNAELSNSAKKLRSKWREFVNNVQNNDQNNTEDCKATDRAQSKEKRKLKDASNIENGPTLNNVKKLKTDDIKPVVDANKSTTADHQNGVTKNIKTAKCKLGKSRSIGVLEKLSNEKDADNKPVSASNGGDHKLNHHSTVGNSFLSKGSMLVNQTASTPSMPLNKLSKSNDKGIQLIDAQPLPASELISSTVGHSTKHIIKESAGFMDALSSVPASTKIKKKKKISASSKEKAVDSDPDMMDLDNSIGDLNQNSANDSRQDENNSLESTTSLNASEIEFLTFSNASPYDPLREPKKGILLYVPRGHKRKISWPDDDKLEKVKFFELDNKERCNVTKESNSFNQHRKEEMQNERNEMNNIRHLKQLKDNPGVELMKWCVIPIDLTGFDTFERSTSSEEKRIQEERLKDVLEFIELPDRPEFPREPDANDSNQLDTSQTKVIPLEDENNLVNDYSNQQYSIVGDQQSDSYPTSDNMYYNNLINSQSQMNSQFLNLNNVNQLLNNPNAYDQQPQQIYMPYENGTHQSQMVNQQIPTDQQNRWTNSNWETTTNHQTNYYSNNKFNNQNKNANKKQSTACKFWIRSKNCRHGDKCHFLHQSN